MLLSLANLAVVEIATIALVVAVLILYFKVDAPRNRDHHGPFYIGSYPFYSHHIPEYIGYYFVGWGMALFHVPLLSLVLFMLALGVYGIGLRRHSAEVLKINADPLRASIVTVSTLWILWLLGYFFPVDFGSLL
jgi:hypothetical protein